MEYLFRDFHKRWQNSELLLITCFITFMSSAFRPNILIFLITFVTYFHEFRPGFLGISHRFSLEKLANSRQVSSRSEILIAPIARHFLALSERNKSIKEMRIHKNLGVKCYTKNVENFFYMQVIWLVFFCFLILIVDSTIFIFHCNTKNQCLGPSVISLWNGSSYICSSILNRI
jgi:hypothetical protein